MTAFPTSRAALALCVLAPLIALGQSEEPGLRPAGSRVRTAAEEQRYHTGPDELQPTIRRPAGFRPLEREAAKEALAALSAAVPERGLDSLLPGFEEYRAVAERLRRVGQAHSDVTVREIGAIEGLPVHAVEIPSTSSEPRPRVFIMAGVHAGTEKAGFEAATRFAESAAGDRALRAKFDITLIPLVSPAALVLGQRENAAGVDINRTFADGKWTAETRIVADYVAGRSFHVHLDLHTAGDPGRDGFFLIRAQPDGGLGARIMRAFPSAALLDAPGAKPGEAAVGPYKLYGVGATTIESIAGTSMDLLVRQGTPYVYTFEAATRADPELQVRGMLKFVHSSLHNARKYGRFDRPRPPKGQVSEETAPEPRVDLERYRRVDGTVRWNEALRARVLPEIGGAAHFALALFLKEVAVVAATGDRVRIEEFFQALLTTDFYEQYGLFVLGARAGQAAYANLLQRYVRPRFVSGLLKTNLVLGTGLALPMLVNGDFEGKTFLISLGALGLSSSAVRAGLKGIEWVVDLRRAPRPVRWPRIARAGGWFYTAAELAVVLYVAEEIEQYVHTRRDARETRQTLAAAALRFVAVASDPATDEASLTAAAEAHAQAWLDYRNALYAPLLQDEAQLRARVDRLARRAKVQADTSRSLQQLAAYPNLAAHAESQARSIERYAQSLLEGSEQELRQKVEASLASYERDRERHLEEVYRGNLRGRPLLDDVKPLGKGLSRALEDVSRNRLEAYADELELLTALAEDLRDQGRDDLAAGVDDAAREVSLLLEADQRLIGAPGMTEALGDR